MFNEDYSSATDFFCNIMTSEDVLHIEVLMNKINKAPIAAKRYLEKHCRNARELEEFFKDNDYLFFLENKRVALYDDQLMEDCEMSVNYFTQRLKDYGRPVDYMVLKLENLERAPSRVCYFMTRFYPGKEIKYFFKGRPDIFVLHKNHTVFLVEVDSIEFYRKRLKAGQKREFLRFRGRVSQAPPHVRLYINRNFPDDEFVYFLRRNSDVFRLDENGFVSLVSSI